MQDQQPTTAVTTTQDSSTDELKPRGPRNRKERRQKAAIDKRVRRMAEKQSGKRLGMYRQLVARREEALEQGKLTPDQADSVFRVALNNLFRRNFKESKDFDKRISQIVKNVREGFKYKVDVKPEAETLDDTAQDTDETT